MSIGLPINRVPDLADASLVGAWLNKKVAGSGRDYSSYGNNGTVVGTPTPLARGGFLFDGIGDYINFGNKVNLDTEDTTFTFWFKNVSNKTIISKRNNVAGAPGYYLGINANVFYGVVQDPSGSVILPGSTNVVSKIKWQFAALVLDRDSNGQWYLNGVPDGNAIDISDRSGSLDNTQNLYIGYNGFTIYIDGSIKDVRIYTEVKKRDWLKYQYLLGCPEG